MSNKKYEQLRTLITNPAIANFLDSSLKSAMILSTNANGGAAIRRTPTRNPSGEPHPKPGSPPISHRINAQGDRANQKLVLPIFMLIL